MDYETARHNMIEQQIRPWDVLDPVVLDLLAKVRREDFVPPVYRSLAFADLEIPLGEGEAMWAPKIEARVLQAVQVQRHEKVLEVGTGSGYLAALLANLAGQVISLERIPALREEADRKLKAHGLNNVTLKAGDGARDWAEDGLFDVIILTGSVPVMPEAYLKRLNRGGRLFAIVGEGAAMSARLITHVEHGAFRDETLFETSVKALANAPEPERFVF
jgi:protein-L-isoaspartate(D-aspartate) O-methyltransferase